MDIKIVNHDKHYEEKQYCVEVENKKVVVFQDKKKPFEMSFKLKFEGLDGNTHRKCNRNIEEYFSQKEQQE